MHKLLSLLIVCFILLSTELFSQTFGCGEECLTAPSYGDTTVFIDQGPGQPACSIKVFYKTQTCNNVKVIKIRDVRAIGGCSGLAITPDVLFYLGLTGMLEYNLFNIFNGASQLYFPSCWSWETFGENISPCDSNECCRISIVADTNTCGDPVYRHARSVYFRECIQPVPPPPPPFPLPPPPPPPPCYNVCPMINSIQDFLDYIGQGE